MRRWLVLTPLAVLCAFGGCDPEGITAPSAWSPDLERSGDPALDVLTYNVYVGARIEELLQVEDPNQIPFKAAELFAKIQGTRFEERAVAIADQIARRRPHLVGLQEISLFRVQSPGDFLAGNPQAAAIPVLDYVEILTDALAARGLSYTVAAASTNFDIELPIVNFGTGGLDDIRLTDFDVVLVRDDVEWSNPQNANFAAVLPIDLGGATIPKPSGWASVDVVFKRLPYRFVNTHLEPADVAPGVVVPELAALQAAQIDELLAIVDASPLPVIMAGDFNTDDDGSTTPTYQAVRDAGFIDAWLVARPQGEGFTANQAPDLRNPVSQLFHRIDFIFYRDRFTRESGLFQGSVDAERVGAEEGDRTASGLWPSDHAGVAASLRIAPGLGHPD
jgi:hypothetical protein